MRRVMVFLWILALAVVGVGADDIEPSNQTDYWLTTLDEYDAIGFPVDVPVEERPALFVLQTGQAVAVTLTGDAFPTELNLSAAGMPGGELVAEETFTIPGGDTLTLTWDVDLAPGTYTITAEPRSAVELISYSWVVEVLTVSDAAEHYTEPPPVMLNHAGGVVQYGLKGGYCYPPVEEGVEDDLSHCLLYDAPPQPDEFFPIAENGIDIDLLASPYPTRVAFYLLNNETKRSASSRTFIELDPAVGQTDFTWKPDLPPGDYVLTVFLDWGQAADASYYYGVTLP